MINKELEIIAKNNEYDFIHIQETNSTMNDVKNYLKDNNGNCIIISDTQTAGKGRRGNLWISPKGNLYCSLSFYNFLSIKDHYLYNVLISVSIKKALEKFNIKNIKFKWPNDILHKKSKFCGMISETFMNENSKSYIIIGFGINIISAPKIKNYSTTYVKSFCDLFVNDDFLLIFFHSLFDNLKKLKNFESKNLVNFFRDSLMFKNEYIEIKLPNNNITGGIFEDINTDGSLRLKTKNNTINIYNGSIII